ncbi:FAD binding domain-containing protein [Hypoxylon trugodes]|uniref:FAD binding domain-containing protein n=1 Tax=Hypoxylon trugodes TaxID=326681 RepID=UPI002199A708|nr:FAD binding domain-containing protein [Hypoxylon trugodes]KAI1390867.1 FAD binding domain-containing protein [Hypoxylon trugodes]
MTETVGKESFNSKGFRTAKLLGTSPSTFTLMQGTPAYEEARKGFWSQEQADCTPYCIRQPKNAQGVAEVLSVLEETGCPFAIKSGGHGRSQGESSISAGVLIDLKYLNNIQLSEDKRTCRVGPGCTWAEVYGQLNPAGLTVIGGRASTVGVGGFCISGGISFFSNRHGWALDNVLSFEVVLSGGIMLQASPSSHPDLYKALRGGGANFGIVTDLELAVYPYEGIWGGGVSWAWEHGDAIIDTFIEYGEDNVGNADAAAILGTVNYQGQWIWYAELEHLKPTPPEKRSVLGRFLKIPSLLDATGPTSQIERTDSIVSHYPTGCHNGYWTFCTQVDKRILKYFMETWREEVDPLLDIDGIDKAALADVNFVSQNIVDAMSRNGGNALGLAGKGPFLLFLMESLWMETAQSERDVYSGYGATAKDFLALVSDKYDPKSIFQHQRGAGWHLHGSILGPVDGQGANSTKA